MQGSRFIDFADGQPGERLQHRDRMGMGISSVFTPSWLDDARIAQRNFTASRCANGQIQGCGSGAGSGLGWLRLGLRLRLRLRLRLNSG